MFTILFSFFCYHLCSCVSFIFCFVFLNFIIRFDFVYFLYLFWVFQVFDMCSIVFFFLLSFFNLQQQQLIIVLHLSVFFPYFRVNTFKSRGGLVALNLKNVVFSCVFLKEKGKFKILKQKNEKKNTATNFSDGCLPAADHGHAQNKQLLLWSKSSKLL